ncbi:hypothetical protein B0H13DRAFT_2339624 [Mycena leptocephala]|nr:hypothetical protein B0H13DRAFT_2339624 [Mycena leptocephala]
MSSSHLPYVKGHGVKSHPGNILVLAVAEDSKILASGGYEGTCVWSMDTMTQLKQPSAAGSRGATGSLLWVRQTEEPRDVLYSGTQNGYFFTWRQVDERLFAIQMTNPSEITGLGFDTTSNQLCICSRNDIVQSWIYTNLSPQAIMFAAFDNTRDWDIIVCGLHNNGPIYTLWGKTGEIASDWSVGARIGDAAVNWREGIICLDDPAAGLTLFHLADQTKARVFEIPRERELEMRARHVRFAESGWAVISGSDHGVVYVFETRTGNILQKLEIGALQWVQAIATAEIDGVPIIFAALTRADDGWEEIHMWKRCGDITIGWNKVGALVKALIVLGCLAFIYQNLGGYIEAWFSSPLIHTNLDISAGRAGEQVVRVGKDIIGVGLEAL